MLTVQNLSFRYGAAPVLSEISLTVERGDIAVVLGPNGAGKTTLLKCLNRILTPASGKVLVEGRPVASMSRNELGRTFAYIPQTQPVTETTVFDAVLLGRRPHIAWRMSRKDVTMTAAILDRMGLADLSLRYLDELSGGERQKVGIARALLQEPKVLLLDEPTSNLDLRNQLEAMETVSRIAREHAMAVVVSMHDLNLALRYGTRFFFLKKGCLVENALQGTLTRDMVERVYDVRVEMTMHRGTPVVLPGEPLPT